MSNPLALRTAIGELMAAAVLQPISDKQLKMVPWHGRYPYLSILILYSTNLPRSLQEEIGNCLLATIRRYIYFLRTYSGFKKLQINQMWNFYLQSKQKQRWFNASPKLHKAYSLIMVLPHPVLNYMDQHASGLVDFLSIQSLTCQVDLVRSRQLIEQCLNLSSNQLMQLPMCPEEDVVPGEIDLIEILGEEFITN